MLAGAELIYSSGSMQPVVEAVRIYVWIFPGVIDLNPVALIDGRFPIVRRISVVECRELNEHARVIIRERHSQVVRPLCEIGWGKQPRELRSDTLTRLCLRRKRSF